MTTATDIPSASRTTEAPVIIIQPTHGWRSLRLREIWNYRELLYFLVWRDIKVRYKQTLLGASWAVLQPFLTMVVFSLFFGRLANVPSDNIPYPIFSYAALLPWTFFANGLTMASLSIVGNANLVKRVYFPRMVAPLAAIIAGLPDFLLAFIILIGMMFVYGIFPPITAVVWLPLFLLLAMITCLGVGLWLAGLNAKYRDIRYALPFAIQLWLFATPVAYPSSLLDEPWRTLYGLNPMVGVVEGFRWALLGRGNPPGLMMVISALISLAILVLGALYFRRVERTLADVL